MLTHLRRRRGCPPPKARVLAQGTTLYSRTPQECSSWGQYSTFTPPQQGEFRRRKDSREATPKGSSLRTSLKLASSYSSKGARRHDGNRKEIPSINPFPSRTFSEDVLHAKRHKESDMSTSGRSWRLSGTAQSASSPALPAPYRSRDGGQNTHLSEAVLHHQAWSSESVFTLRKELRYPGRSARELSSTIRRKRLS